ncbi:bifunctional [glutamate--ammonia ligase]-adenylyl-L-tyrosine phosphorylase/[glutamate--ammonia-ligase] adenylyltransferase [Alkalimonas collagenimarina]|uniref:Bifunctional glutamine synthetase adenylyltransferase/adenylyl-removing enzyme n=1 Tax=Alkalimonas collagenimarina TaxID=400390 RepID=A0ABT9GYR1_9GAMM|nr:bifunctional [glutamate--ammonia ligase]-adenylyl-L-tyrosine phosphorylase/[glutamate--ammonia-ligase] adenylyltransferase [Alkalimonas collagenimarina]MDP4536172.1 bifunctional [glutamate--ammonia ligase]-adenylyl-L-tyrosine phosphorylase/[glutamate--ammonia-ligase] adenylyltransferase [Alkalimonas collagenimarina]
MSSDAEQRVQQFCQQLPGYQALSSAEQQRVTELALISPFLARTLQQQPDLLSVLLDDKALAAPLPATALEIALTGSDEVTVFKTLRRYRNRMLSQILAADLLQLKSIADCLFDVSVLANDCINSAYQWAYRELTAQWGTPLDDAGEPMPMLILGMGKLGGEELNLSSDIDLIFTYPANGETTGGRRSTDHHQFFLRLGQKLIAALHQVTADGFVYRVDMRLRPFGESGPLALSFAAMEDYYQEQGREWERYAMLKARVINPDGKHSIELKQMLRPFVYRRYIDFSAIESLRRMKQLIEQENRRRNRSDNIKLGAGGIREVEFIVQTLQLIRGGRIPQLQQPSILAALPILVEHQLLTTDQQQQLTSDYLFLRRVEQLLQGMDDQQTQTLPTDAELQQQLIRGLHYSSWTELQQQVEQAMLRIHREFLQVIEPEESTEPEALSVGKLLWDSDALAEDLAEQIDWLDESAAIPLIQQIQQFRDESHRRSVGPRGRDYLSRLIPQVLHLVACSQAGSQVVERILLVFRRIMTRTAYLELLFENPPALQQLVTLCSQSQWLTDQLARYPILLDELIDPAQLYQVQVKADYQDRIRQRLLRVADDDLELLMESLRQHKQAQQLRIAAADISGALPLMQVSDHLTWLAEAMMEQVVELAWQQMVARYGYPAGLDKGSDKGFAVIAYGKMGGMELGYGSDLDLVFVHNCDSLASTTGDKSIDSKQFYLKLVQRVLHLCTTRTASGVLYDIDTRLRPSGNSGLLAIHVQTYGDYLAKEAWTWEHQALVRARIVYGDDTVAQQFQQIRTQILSLPRELVALRHDVLGMRDKLRQHHGSDNEQLKHANGGVIDLEFISQYLVLAHGASTAALFRYSDNIRILDAACDAKLLSAEQVNELQQAYRLMRGIHHRLTLQPVLPPELEGLEQARAAVQAIWRHLFQL